MFAKEEYQTPLENIYRSYFGTETTPYNRYAQYYLENKGDIKTSLEKDSRLLQFNEKTLNFLYDYHILITKRSFFNIDNLFEYNSEKLINTFEGLFIQDIYLREHKVKESLRVIDFSMCETLKFKIDKIACMSNNISISCLNNINYSDNLSKLSKLNSNAAKYSLEYCYKNKE
jgi:hypothetical protein